MRYDLLNNNVRVQGSVRILHFNILSEAMEAGRRTLSLYGYDEMGNEYTAKGWFEKITGLLIVAWLTEVAKQGITIPVAEQVYLTDDNGNILTDENSTLLTGTL